MIRPGLASTLSVLALVGAVCPSAYAAPSVAPLPGSPVVDLTGPNEPFGPVAVARIDGNPLNDVVVRRPSDTLRTLLAPADPLTQPFTVGSTFAAGSLSSNLFAGDVDGDGDSDLTVNGSGQLRALTNDGAGAFTQSPMLLISGSGALALAAGDINADGRQDVVYRDIGGPYPRTYRLGLAGGTYDGGHALSNLQAIVQGIGDVDGDGDGDVVAVTPANTIRVSRNDGGTFSDLPTVASAANAKALAVRDLDGNGRAEIVVLSTAPSQVTVHATDATGAPQAAQSVAAGLNGGATTNALALADLDGDGRLDALVGDETTADLKVLVGIPGPGLASGVALGGPALTAATGVAVGDLTGDGRADVVIASQSGKSVDLLRNTTPWAPRATTSSATATGKDGAHVSGSADPRGIAGTVAVEFGPTAAYGSTTSATALTPGGVQPVEVDLAGLTPGRAYHARVVVTTADGSTPGEDRTFTTAVDAPPPPANAGPVAALSGPGSVVPGGVEVPFDAGGSAGDGLRFTWDVDGDGFTTDTGTTPTLARAFTGVGSHRVTVRVRDAAGRTDQATATVTVPDPAQTKVTTVARGAQVKRDVAIKVTRPGRGLDRFLVGGVNLGRTTAPLNGTGPEVDLAGEVTRDGRSGKVSYPSAGAYALVADTGATEAATGLRFVMGITAGQGTTRKARAAFAYKPNVPNSANAAYVASGPRNTRDGWTIATAFDDDPGLGQFVTFSDASRFSKQGDPVTYTTSADRRPHSLVYDWGDGTTSTSTNGQAVTHRWLKAGTYNVSLTLYDPKLSGPGGLQGKVTVPVKVSTAGAICAAVKNKYGVRISPHLGCFYPAGTAYASTPGTGVFINGLRITGDGLLLTQENTRLAGTNLTLQTANGPVPIPKTLATSLLLSPGANLDLPGTTYQGRKIGQGRFNVNTDPANPFLITQLTFPPPAVGSVSAYLNLVTGVAVPRSSGGGSGGGGSTGFSLGFLDFANLTITNRPGNVVTYGGRASFGPYSLNATDNYAASSVNPAVPPSGVWFRNDSFLAAGATADVPVPVAPGLELGNFKVGVQVAPSFAVSGGAQLRTTGSVFGRRIATVDGCFIAFHAPAGQAGKPTPGCAPNVFFQPTVPAGGQYGVRVNGKVSVLGIDLASGSVSALSPGGVLVEGNYKNAILPFDLLYIEVGVGVGFDPARAALYGQIKARACTDLGDVLKGCFGGADFVLSTVGIGACINTRVVSPGVWYRWGQPLTFSTIWDQSYFWGCTVQKLGKNLMPRSVPPAGLRATLRQDSPTLGATSSVQIKVAKQLPQTVFAVNGEGGAPRVRVTDASGAVVAEDTTPDGRQNGRLVFAHATKGFQTGVFLPKAKPGVYTVTALPSSVPIVSANLQQSIVLKPVRANVRRKGGGYVLDYVAPREAGQKVTFQEKAGTTELGYLPALPAAAQGVLPFTPSGGAYGTRTVLARIEQDGRLIDTYKVATYTLPKPKPPVAPAGVSLRRSGTSLVVSWRAVTGAKGYRVVVRASDGTVVARVLGPNQRRLTVRVLSRLSGATVTVQTRTADYRESRAATARLKPGKPAKPKPLRL